MYLLDKSVNPGQASPVDSPEVAKRKALISLLRNKAAWPKGFEWSYKGHESCAIGLAARARIIPYIQSSCHAGRELGLTQEDAEEIFLNANYSGGKWIMSMTEVTPEHIADLLEATL